jgi:type IX secretion system PorP/SprF family membrane protein
MKRKSACLKIHLLNVKSFIAFFIFSVITTTVKLKAQDPHFSQFFSSPMTLNPAMTGKFNGDFRIAANYRNQWPTINRAFQTATASVDFSVLNDVVPENDNVGIGLMGYTDKSAAGAVNFSYFSLSAAYHKGLDEDGFKQISAGFQATYSNMNINTSNLKFEDQLTPFGFTNATQEIFNTNVLKSSYLDLNAGLLFTSSTTEKNNLYAGVSLYHISRPRQEFTGVAYNLNPRATFHTGGFFPVGYNSTLHLNGLYSTQGGASEAVLGGAFQLGIGDQEVEKPTSFYAGGWYRIGDAVIPFFGLEFSDMRFGFSYDVNISDLRTASQSRGGVEISLIYTHNSFRGKGIPCPKF